MFSDPPGFKVGNGGATMHVLEQLEKTVGWENIQKGGAYTLCNSVYVHTIAILAARILLVHAGGYSQRLPSVSVIGKIFMGLPCGESCHGK